MQVTFLKFQGFIDSLTFKKIVLILIGLGFIIYFRSLFNGFVQDDYSQILENPVTHSLKNIPLAFKGSTFAIGNVINGIYYKPMMTTFFTVVYSIFGPHAFFFHLFQVSFHIVNSILVFLMFKRFFKQTLAFILALVFLVHPINSESVLYISAVQDVLFFLFGMTSFLLLTSKQLDIKKSILGFLFLILAILSKESGFLFVGIIFVYKFLFERKKLLSYTIASILISLCYLLIRHSVLGVYGDEEKVIPIMNTPLVERLMHIPKILSFYLWTFIFPKDLATGQIWVIDRFNFFNFYLPLFIMGILVIVNTLYIAKLYKAKNDLFKEYIFFNLWFLLGLILHLQIVPLDQTVAERYFYFPFIGLLGIIAIGFRKVRFNNYLKFSALLILTVLIFLLSVRTIVRSIDFRNGLELAKKDIQNSKDNIYLENYLAYELSKHGELTEAEKHYLKTTELAPNWWGSWNNLGSVQFKIAKANKNSEKVNEAEISFKRAIEYSKSYSLPYQNYLTLLYQFRSPQQAKEIASEAVKKYPNDPKIWFYLSLSEYESGNKKEAIEAMRRALMLDSRNRQYQQLYMLLQQGKQFEIKKD